MQIRKLQKLIKSAWNRSILEKDEDAEINFKIM
jgi:hypothetical protein